MLSRLKSRLFAPGSRPRQVRFGIYRGLRLEIDLTHQMQLYLGLQERETHPYIRRALRRCAWMVDVGAGVGELSCLALRRSPAQSVYAFEPGRSERAAFSLNLQLNHLQDDRRLVVADKFVGCAARSDYASLDSLPLDVRLRGFIKIDVDGAEIDVLLSGDRLFSDGAVDVLLETHSLALEQKSRAFLSARNYTCSVIDHAAWRIVAPEHRPIGHNRWLWATKH